MTTLREALIQARAEFDELPAGEIRRSVDNILNDDSLIAEECRTDSVIPYPFYEGLKTEPF